jgi:divalent anion:Na+ symporter, DASS family
MFLTSMAANPLAAELAGKAGIAVSWTTWAIAGIVPGLIGIAVVPWLIYKVYPPEVKETPAAAQLAREKLAEMGRVSWREWILLATFVTLIVLWVFEKQIGVDNTIAAMVGLGMLQITGVLTWRDVLEESAAWDTIVWFSSLVMMASFLSNLGMIGWFSHTVGSSLAGHGWMVTLIILLVIYTYSHYAFASATAHVSAMYPAFLGVSIAAGAPPLLAALAFGFFSNVMGGMTHYGFGPAPVLYGGGYVDIKAWWGYGLLISLLNVAIWLGVGLLWWKLVGIW